MITMNVKVSNIALILATILIICAIAYVIVGWILNDVVIAIGGGALCSLFSFIVLTANTKVIDSKDEAE